MSLSFEGCLLAVSIFFKAKSSRCPCLVDKSGQTSSLQRSSTCQWRSATNRWGISQLPALLKTQSKFRWQGLPIKDNQILLPQGSMLHDHSPHSWDATSTLHRTKVLMDHDKLRETEREREREERERERDISTVTNQKHIQTQ